MKRIAAILIALIIGFGIAFAKSDYKNPVESQIVAELVIQPNSNPYNKVERDMYLAVDKYDNHFISINVTYFYKKGKDNLNITLKNGDSFTVTPTKFLNVEKGTYKNGTYTASARITTVGNYTTVNTSVRENKTTYYDAYSIYQITAEQYSKILEAGLDSISVEGIYQIIIQ
jgi:hypothetical protein